MLERSIWKIWARSNRESKILRRIAPFPKIGSATSGMGSTARAMVDKFNKCLEKLGAPAFDGRSRNEVPSCSAIAAKLRCVKNESSRTNDPGAAARMKPEVLQDVAHIVSQEGSLEVALKRIVEGLAGRGGIALARVWLKRGAGELCERRSYHKCSLPPQRLVADR